MGVINIIIFITCFHYILSIELDPLGYILYCPCMGRFGNQADHFLGALNFAHALNRTLILPPWVEYRYGESKSIQVPFVTYFQIKPLMVYHKVFTMEEFMEKVAPIEWPEKERISFCYTARGDGSGCNAKDGNPFGPFWNTFNINFVASEFYEPLHYDTHDKAMVKKWKEKYSASRWPVLAFTGAPAGFPVSAENRALHKYMEWSETIERLAINFIKTVLPRGAFVGIHLRNGVDWVRACEHIPESPSLFAASQCVGYHNEKGNATVDMCLPSKETIIRQLKRRIKTINNSATKNDDHTVKSIFVASDNNHLIADLTNALDRMKIPVFKYSSNNPHVDLAILGKSNHFIGNCISSFSAFVKRERDVKGFSSTFWAFPSEKNYIKKSHVHEEF